MFPDSCSSVNEDFACGQVGTRQPYLCFSQSEGVEYQCNEDFIIPCDDDNDGCANEEICDDADGKDEDCNGKSNCADPACSPRNYCRTECDKDGDKHFSNSFACQGDDCKDDPAFEPKAAQIFTGNTENTAALCGDTLDNDCDTIPDCDDQSCQDAGKQGGFCASPEVCDDDDNLDEDNNGASNCSDSNCVEHPHCSTGGGSGGSGGDNSTYYYSYSSCSAFYMVTTYYLCNSSGCTYLSESWEFIGIACSAF